MIAVIFEGWVPGHAQGGYLGLSAELRPLLDDLNGFISIERFKSLTTPGKVHPLGDGKHVTVNYGQKSRMTTWHPVVCRHNGLTSRQKG